MNIQRPYFGRLTINGKRIDLGHADFSMLLKRAAQQFIGHRSESKDPVITIEMSANKLPDSLLLSREQILEQSLAAQTVTELDEESPFEGITIGRVQEAMMSPEYQRYADLCNPDKRLGLTIRDVERAQIAYRDAFPDCFPHFPKYIDS